MSYPASEIRALLARGSVEGEDFYRLKVTGNGETKWVNVSPEQLATIAAILDEDDLALVTNALTCYSGQLRVSEQEAREYEQNAVTPDQITTFQRLAKTHARTDRRVHQLLERIG